MRWLRRLFLFVLALAVLAGLALTVLLTMDLSRFKGRVETYVSAKTGRDFVITGRFEPHIGKTVELVAEGVQLGNAEWGVAESILTVGRLDISVDSWSLINGPIVIHRLDVESLAVNVEADPRTGKSAWDFSAVDADVADAVGRADEGGWLADGELPFILEQAGLKDISVVYGEGWLEQSREITIDEGEVRERADGLLALTADGAIEDLAVTMVGEAGPLEALVSGQSPELELEVAVGAYRYAVTGSVEELYALRGIDIAYRFQGPPAQTLLERLGLPQIAQGPVDMEGRIWQESDGVHTRLAGDFGDLKSDISTVADTLIDASRGSVTFDVRGPNLDAISSLFDVDFLPAEEFQLNGSIDAGGDLVRLEAVSARVGDASLSIDGSVGRPPGYAGTRLSLAASGSRIEDFLQPALAWSRPSGDFEVSAELAGGVAGVSVQAGTIRVGENRASVVGTLGELSGLDGLDIQISARGPDLDAVAGQWLDDLPGDAYDATVTVARHGGVFSLRDAHLSVGESSLQASGPLGKLPDFAGLDAQVRFRGPDLNAVLEPFADVTVPSGEFDISGAVALRDGAFSIRGLNARVGPHRASLDGTLGSLPGFRGLRLEVGLNTPDAVAFRRQAADDEPLDHYFRVPADPLETSGVVRRTEQGWIVEQWSLRIGEDRFEVKGNLGDLQSMNGVFLDVRASGSDLREFLAKQNMPVPLPYTLDGRVTFAAEQLDFEGVHLRIGEASAYVNGRVPKSFRLDDAQFEVRLSGPQLQEVGRFIGVGGLPAGPFRFDGKLTREGSTYVVEDLVAEAADNNLTGDIRFVLAERASLMGRLESKKLDLTPFLGGAAQHNSQAPEADDQRRLISDARLPMALLDVADVDVTLHISELQTRHFEIGDVELVVLIDSSRMHIETGDLRLRQGTATAILDLERITAGGRLNVELSGQGLSIRKPIDSAGNPIRRPPLDLIVSLQGDGATYRDVVAAAKGFISVQSGRGQIDNTFGGLLVRDLVAQVFAAINPLSKDQPYTNLDCAVVSARVDDGVLDTDAIVIQTDKLAIASLGSIDLATEELDFSFRVKQREGIGISLSDVINPYVKLAGTVTEPAIEIDKKRGFLSGTVAVLTGGLSILAQGVWDRYFKADDMCQAVIAGIESGEIGGEETSEQKSGWRPFRRKKKPAD